MPQLVAGWIASALTSIGIGSTLAGALGSLGASLLFSAASALLSGGGQSQQDMRQDLRLPRSLPAKRWVYGRTRMPASWLPPVVINGVLYGCCILNSRPSAGGTVRILIDRREVTLSAGLTDFAVGADATNAPFTGHAKFWLGLGGQTGVPAQIMTEAGDALAADPDKFWPTDAWQGATVLWCRLRAGDNSSRSERWQSNPPQIDVEMDWSRVWDPRDEAQDPDDAATWGWSDNQALCLLDAIRTNPLRRRKLSQIRLADFIEGANVADQAVPILAGGTEPRYRVGGFIVWSRQQELLDQLTPLVLAGAGVLRQVGGRLGYLSGRYYAPLATVGDVLDDAPVRHVSRQPARDVPFAVRAVFPDPAQEYEDGALYPIPVASRDWDGGDDGVIEARYGLVPYARQAQRLAQIAARQLAQEGRLTCELPPEFLDVIVGARVTVALPGPDVRSGVWMVDSLNPHVWQGQDDTLVFKMAASLRRDAASVWEWDPEDEQDLYSAPVPPLDLTLAPPTGLTAELDGTVLEVDFTTVTAAGFYEWQIKPLGSDIWQPQPDLSADLVNGGPTITAQITVPASAAYDVRLRARLGAQASVWVSAVAAWSGQHLPALDGALAWAGAFGSGWEHPLPEVYDYSLQGNPGAVVGNPVAEPGFAVVNSTNYIEAAITDSGAIAAGAADQFTLICVASGLPDSGIAELVSTRGTSVQSGFALRLGASGTLLFYADKGAETAANVTLAAGASGSGPQFYAATVDGLNVDLFRRGAGDSAMLTRAGVLSTLSGIEGRGVVWRVGAAYAGTAPTIRAGIVAIYNRSLTPAEIATVYDAAKARMAQRGVVI